MEIKLNLKVRTRRIRKQTKALIKLLKSLIETRDEMIDKNIYNIHCGIVISSKQKKKYIEIYPLLDNIYISIGEKDG